MTREGSASDMAQRRFIRLEPLLHAPAAAAFPVDNAKESWQTPLRMPNERATDIDRLELLRGTLDLLILRTLLSMGPMHGYGIARRIEQVSGEGVLLNEGTVYASLVRLQQRRWISA